MTSLILTKTKLRQGVWEGLLTGSVQDTSPELDVVHQGNQVPDVTVTALEDKSGFAVRVPIPQDAIADGMQTIVVSDTKSDEQLATITLMAGEALGDDMRVEVDLLRAELDMLKRAFRRHCLETT
ncbi:hypothetical protein [uncultured Sulfitobacter sp.]|uniref:hypothetical protein n=1 Tax=uncultured Sulfitobacter sp. TaxID=191468 RepID=UPI002630744D|nr:hypothetical protein [uncultured Sulfitobacter sp.]